LPVRLDVTDRGADFAAVKLAHDYFGRLDVVVNNAGYGQFGMVEEISESEIRAQLETNLLGALWVTQAALPYLRGQGSGHIVQVSSIGGISAFMNTGAYHASKWALEGLSQSLAAEVAGFGISRHADRADRLRHGLGRLLRQARDAAARLRAGPGAGGAGPRSALHARRSECHPRRGADARGYPEPAAALVPGRGAAGYRDRGLRVQARDLAGMAARGRRRPEPWTVRPDAPPVAGGDTARPWRREAGDGGRRDHHGISPEHGPVSALPKMVSPLVEAAPRQ